MRAVKVQCAYDLAAVKKALPTIFLKADAHTVLFLWSRSYCRCATFLSEVLPVSTRRYSMRIERGPRSRAATQLGPLATNGRELSSSKGVKLQSAPTILPRQTTFPKGPRANY